MNKHLKWVVNQWIAQKWFVLIMVFFTIISSAVALAYPFVFKKLIDLMSDILSNPAKYPAPMQEVKKIILVFLAIGLAEIVTGFYPSFRAMLNLRFEHSLRMFYFKFLTRKDYRFFQIFRTGDIVTRLTDDISDYPKISWFLCSGIFRAFDSFCIISFSLIVMFSLNWRLTLLSIASLPGMMLIFYLTSDKVYKNFEANQKAISEINNQLELSFSGIRIVKAFVSEHKYNRFFDTALAKRFKTEMNMIKLNTILHMIWNYIDYIAQIGVIMFGGYMAVKGQISIGTFFLFYTYLSMMIYPLLDLPQLFLSGKQAFVNIDRLNEIKEFPTQIREDRQRIPLEEFCELSFDNVSFTYHGKAEPVIRNCSFNLKRGEKLLILGSTGCGKTTIANLISGLLLPCEGQILMNGIPMDNLDLNTWREIIGFVPQDPVLFSGTIKENVHFATEDKTHQDYQKAIRISQLDSEIDSFPDKDETIVGQRGLGVSGGQKQRITIARALIKQPQLLILDDITASLDAENEEKLWQELNRAYPNLAAVMISHRLSTLRYTDSILYIDKQGHCHKGTHEELVFANEEYHDFLHEHLKKD
ncbi:MAG: ABC transporter ATP-binding protein [Candidatus Cloacimonetes bacterium]|nr:ABC transporter ATP-binding protein [Candidatus Cloacimonadota bacterium]